MAAVLRSERTEPNADMAGCSSVGRLVQTRILTVSKKDTESLPIGYRIVNCKLLKWGSCPVDNADKVGDGKTRRTARTTPDVIGAYEPVNDALGRTPSWLSWMWGKKRV